MADYKKIFLFINGHPIYPIMRILSLNGYYTRFLEAFRSKGENTLAGSSISESVKSYFHNVKSPSNIWKGGSSSYFFQKILGFIVYHLLWKRDFYTCSI